MSHEPQLQFIRYNSQLTKYSSSYLEPCLKILTWKFRSIYRAAWNADAV